MRRFSKFITLFVLGISGCGQSGAVLSPNTSSQSAPPNTSSQNSPTTYYGVLHVSCQACIGGPTFISTAQTTYLLIGSQSTTQAQQALQAIVASVGSSGGSVNIQFTGQFGSETGVLPNPTATYQDVQLSSISCY